MDSLVRGGHSNISMAIKVSFSRAIPRSDSSELDENHSKAIVVSFREITRIFGLALNFVGLFFSATTDPDHVVGPHRAHGSPFDIFGGKLLRLDIGATEIILSGLLRQRFCRTEVVTQEALVERCVMLNRSTGTQKARQASQKDDSENRGRCKHKRSHKERGLRQKRYQPMKTEADTVFMLL